MVNTCARLVRKHVSVLYEGGVSEVCGSGWLLSAPLHDLTHCSSSNVQYMARAFNTFLSLKRPCKNRRSWIQFRSGYSTRNSLPIVVLPMVSMVTNILVLRVATCMWITPVGFSQCESVRVMHILTTLSKQIYK